MLLSLVLLRLFFFYSLYTLLFFFFFFLIIRPPPSSPLFPYTTLFRSVEPPRRRGTPPHHLRPQPRLFPLQGPQPADCAPPPRSTADILAGLLCPHPAPALPSAPLT